MLYAGDEPWWKHYGGEVERDFKGELWTRDVRMEFANYVEGVDETGLCTKPGRIHLGGNSGYQLINLVFHWGVARIILLGYDMQLGPRGERHHHGNHPNGLSNLGADLREWARRFIQLGIDLRAHGVDVINASRRTAITCFARMPLEQALGGQTVASESAALLIPRDLLPREHSAFRDGLAAAGFGDGGQPDITVVWNCRMPQPRPAGRLLVAENGYLQGPGGQYVALASGGHNGAGQYPYGGPERFARLGVDLVPWRASGGHILVCESRQLDEPALRPPKDWTARTVETLRRYTSREIRVRPHPGNWKQRAGEVEKSLQRDLDGAHACVIWRSGAGLRALAAGVPVIYTAPHWIAEAAAGDRLDQIESPPMPDRLPVFQRLAWAQWSLDEIASGEPFRALTEMITVLCVLRSGGDFDVEYVRKLRDGVARNLTIPHRFVCLSDVAVPCETIKLKHDWPGWWSKIEIFRPGVITGPTLYLDLDTVIVGNIDAVATIPHEFAMLNIREKDLPIGNSGAMWISRPQPHVYERFAEKPRYWIDYHIRNAKERYAGDQAFISDSFKEIHTLNKALPGVFKAYKHDQCQNAIPPGCSVVCFSGKPRPREARGWVERVWI